MACQLLALCELCEVAFAELATIYVGPNLANDNSGSIEYQHVRTASPDSGAGGGVSSKPAKLPATVKQKIKAIVARH
jgi:hypothetical protein